MYISIPPTGIQRGKIRLGIVRVQKTPAQAPTLSSIGLIIGRSRQLEYERIHPFWLELLPRPPFSTPSERSCSTNTFELQDAIS
ncbi:hypothetical protein Q31a_01610 [Aureliella helgolandensis]|uniref:Uncharacterized protein n=1 Tax=Aureliella helgolandensis TaxID=2527968 RepID=A0A518FZV0_9BACT|nr:hypothetical protein Q31a_01610 [Aureliella helgolandensis]